MRRLAAWRHVLCCAPSYLEAHGEPLKLEDLAEHDCLRYTYYPFGNEWRFSDPDGRPAAVRVSGRLVTTSADALRAAALRGLGLLLAPDFFSTDDLDAGRLVSVLTQYRPVEFAITAIYPHRHLVSAKVRAFLDLLATRIGEHRRWITPWYPAPQ